MCAFMVSFYDGGGSSAVQLKKEKKCDLNEDTITAEIIAGV